MQKIDYKKDLKYLYKPSSKNITTVDVPGMNFLMIDGIGDPNKEKSFGESINTLFSISYTLKFMIKKGEIEISDKPGPNYAVRPLECLWWADDMTDFVKMRKDKWKWILMVAQPEFINMEMITAAIEKAKKKKPLIHISKMHFNKFEEGKSAHILYIGPYDNEGPTIKIIHKYIVDQGGLLTGKHHEIYLSDMRRTAPEKLRTIIRQPFSLSG